MQDEMKRKLENTILKSCKYHMFTRKSSIICSANQRAASIWKIARGNFYDFT